MQNKKSYAESEKEIITIDKTLFAEILRIKTHKEVSYSVCLTQPELLQQYINVFYISVPAEIHDTKQQMIKDEILSLTSDTELCKRLWKARYNEAISVE